MGWGRGGRGKRARRSDLWSAEGTGGAGQRRGGPRGRSLPRQRPASAAVSSVAVSMGDGEQLAPLSHPLVKRLHRQAAERTLRTAVQHQEPERTAALSRLRRLAKAGQASDSGDDPVPPAADIPDGEADVLPGLRKAVVARGQHLWESWGSSCAFAVAAQPTSAPMGPADFAAMAVRLAGTARGSSYEFLAATASHVDSPDAEVDSTADSAKAAGGDEAGSALEDTTGHLVSGDGWPTDSGVRWASGQSSGQRRWAAGALCQDLAGFVDLASGDDSGDSGQQSSGHPSSASESSATVEFQEPAWAPVRRRR